MARLTLHNDPARRSLLAIALLVLGVALVSAVGTTAAVASPAANAAAKKKCSGGKVLVRRPGRGSVCAKKCPAGNKRKVSRSGKLSCEKKKQSAPTAPTGGGQPNPTATTPTSPPAPTPASPPAATGPAAGKYSGQTDQQRPVGFLVEGGTIKTFEAGVNTWCSTMYNARLVLDAIANVPPMPIGPDGTFSYTGDETNGNMKITGAVKGSTASGTVGMFRGDTNYSGGQMYFGSCSASDITWSATAG